MGDYLDIRSACRSPGVIWLGKDQETTAVIHSQKCGIILRGSALNESVEGNQPMEFKPAYIQIRDLVLMAVYQPVSAHGNEAIEEYRHDLENLLTRRTQRMNKDMASLTGATESAWNGSTAPLAIESGGLYSTRDSGTDMNLMVL